MQNRHLRLLNDPEARQRVTDAITTLKQFRVFDILRENALPMIADPSHSQGEQIAIAAHYRTVGYILCLENLEYFTDIPDNTVSKLPTPDFGAREALKKSGVSDQELERLLSEDK